MFKRYRFNCKYGPISTNYWTAKFLILWLYLKDPSWMTIGATNAKPVIFACPLCL